MKVISRNVNFQMGPTLLNLKLQNSIYELKIKEKSNLILPDRLYKML